MKKQLKEQSRVKQLLKDGLVINYYVSNDCLATNSDSWNPTVHYSYGLADLALLIKWFSRQGLKPKRIKEEIIKLWLNYDPLVDFQILNKMITRIRAKKDYELIEVVGVSLSSDAMQWFKDQDLGHEAVKLAFTFYVWAKIQEQYKEFGATTIFGDNSWTMLKRSADIKQNVKLLDVLRELFQKGYVDIPMGKLRRYVIDFYDKVPTTGEEVIISDFDHIGKFYEDYFDIKNSRHVKKPVDDVCPVCGKAFEHKSKRHDECCLSCRKEKEREKDRLKKQRKRERLKNEENKIDT